MGGGGGVDCGGGGGCGVGVGGSPDGKSHVTFYINTGDVAGKLKEVEAKGGHTVMGAEDMDMVEIGLFVDPDGALIGLMKPKQG